MNGRALIIIYPIVLLLLLYTQTRSMSTAKPEVETYILHKLSKQQTNKTTKQTKHKNNETNNGIASI
jgi:hypothetical protein